MAHSHSHLREHHPGRKRAHEMKKHFNRGGTVKTTKRAAGGVVGKRGDDEDEEMHAEGKKAGGRLDKYARGGRAKKGGGHTNVNVIVAPHGPHPAAGAAPAVPPGGPPMPPPGGGGPPPGLGGPPGMPPGGGLPPGMSKPPGMMKKGGRVKKYAKGGKIGMTAGADSGEGRLQKAKKYSAK